MSLIMLCRNIVCTLQMYATLFCTRVMKCWRHHLLQVQDARVLGFKPGDEIQVKYFGNDPISGQVRLSRRLLLTPASQAFQWWGHVSSGWTRATVTDSGSTNDARCRAWYWDPWDETRDLDTVWKWRGQIDPPVILSYCWDLSNMLILLLNCDHIAI